MTTQGLSFDIEDWHQLSQMRLDGTPGEPSSSVDDCVARILDLCDESRVKGTFFVLGLLARARPHLVKRIARRGHEIASHSSRHPLVHSMSSADFTADVRDSKELLEDLTGQQVVGFRAPEFSVQRVDHPCFGSLVELGFRYDSSVFPASWLRYGIPNAPRTPFSITTRAGTLIELPLATLSLGGVRLPFAGGSHFRLLPTSLVVRATRRAVRRRESLVYYFHPYEFTRDLLSLQGGLARNARIAKHLLLHNFATWRISASLRKLLHEFEFGPLREIAANVRETNNEQA